MIHNLCILVGCFTIISSGFDDEIYDSVWKIKNGMIWKKFLI